MRDLRTKLSPLFGPTLGLAVLSGVVGVSYVATQVLPPTQNVAEARKRKKRKRASRPAEPQREIRQEGDLAPRKDVALDAELSKTKDLKQDLGEARPTLNPDQLKTADMQTLMGAKLDEEIESSRLLLELETECDKSAPVRFRLADLYWEKSKRAFFRANDFNMSETDRRRAAKEMKSLQAATVQNYTTIVDQCPDYDDLSKTLFYLGRTLMELEQPKEAAAYFTRIIKEYPDSQWVPNAWFMVGEFYFNSENDAKKALAAYKRAAEYGNSPVYGFAIYKQGWCHVNTGDWDLALARFREVVTVSDDPSQELDPKGRLALRKEALKDYVRAYSNVGEPKGAFRDFLKVGGKQQVQKMLENLGQWYVNRDGHRDTIVVHGDLIKSFPKSTRLPVYQGRIVHATSRLGDKKATVKQAQLLTNYFQKVRAYKETFKGSEDEVTQLEKDIREAEDIAENTLRGLAMEYHADARKLRGSAADKMYVFARDLYKHYLEVFPNPLPKADVNYVFFMRFYYAEVLYKLEEFLDAARNYDRVVDMNPNPTDKKEKDLVLAAAEESVRSYDEVVADLDRKNPPEISGTEPKPIPPIKQDLIASCQRYIRYVGAEGEKIVEIRYKMARIYYTYNHFDQAAPAFNDIVQNHPDNEVACYSANLALDIYNGEKNYRALKTASRSYLDNTKLACGEEDRTKFAKIEQESTFKLIKTEYEEKSRYVVAANAYMKFSQTFPQSDLADDAVYNAAYSYGKANRMEKANEVREFLVKKFPDSDLVPETIYDIAQSYERIVDFKKAAEYLTLFASKYPSDKRSKDAIYNSGLYRATLRDYAEAKVDRERFIKLYPNEDDLHLVAFAICESLEDEARHMEDRAKAQNKQSAMDGTIRKKWEEAHDCYFKYIKDYSKTDTDLLCHAQYRRGEIMRAKTKYQKGFEEQKKYVLSSWPGWVKRTGKEKLARCAAAVAELTFEDLNGELEQYRGMKISELNPTDKGKKAFEASVQAKVKRRDALAAKYREVVEIGVAEWSLAALFQIGELYRDSIEKLLAAPIPTKIPGYKLTEEDKGLLREELRKMAAPIEDTALEAFRICVDKSNELGVYNRWSVRALDRLQKLRPEQFPPVDERMVPVRLASSYDVVRNGIVIKDSEGNKAAEVSLVESEQPGQPPKGSQGQDGDKKKAKDDTADAQARAETR